MKYIIYVITYCIIVGYTYGQNTYVKSSGGYSNSLNSVSGTLPVINGGTNTTFIGDAGTMVFCDGNKYVYTNAGQAGQILVSNGTATPTWINQSDIVSPDLELTNTLTASQTKTVELTATNPAKSQFDVIIIATNGVNNEIQKFTIFHKDGQGTGYILNQSQYNPNNSDNLLTLNDETSIVNNKISLEITNKKNTDTNLTIYIH